MIDSEIEEIEHISTIEEELERTNQYASQCSELLGIAERERYEALAVLGRLVASLPACDECKVPSTRAFGRGGKRYCDECGAPNGSLGKGKLEVPPYPRAPALREAIKLLRGLDG